MKALASKKTPLSNNGALQPLMLENINEDCKKFSLALQPPKIEHALAGQEIDFAAGTVADLEDHGPRFRRISPSLTNRRMPCIFLYGWRRESLI